MATITVEGKEYELKYVEPDYSTPKATKFLDMALKQEASPEPKMVEKLFEKAVAAELAGE